MSNVFHGCPCQLLTPDAQCMNIVINELTVGTMPSDRARNVLRRQRRMHLAPPGLCVPATVQTRPTVPERLALDPSQRPSTAPIHRETTFSPLNFVVSSPKSSSPVALPRFHPHRPGMTLMCSLGVETTTSRRPARTFVPLGSLTATQPAASRTWLAGTVPRLHHSLLFHHRPPLPWPQAVLCSGKNSF